MKLVYICLKVRKNGAAPQNIAVYISVLLSLWMLLRDSHEASIHIFEGRNQDWWGWDGTTHKSTKIGGTMH